MAVVLSLAVTQLLADGMVAPLRQMTQAARQMARGDYSTRVTTHASDEVGELASAFNQMDLWVGRGVPGLQLTYPRVSGCDACGEVVAIGPGVDKSWLGKRVITNAALRIPETDRPADPPASTLAPIYELIGEHHDGMFKERFNAPVANVADVGATMDPAHA